MPSATEELALAAQCDASGAHADAVNALARAAGLGNVEAKTQLGKRLIAGNNAPLLPTEGAGLLIEAVNGGSAEAAARLAVLAAAGVYVEPGLDHALKLITLSAQRGWQSAQAQLLALTEDRTLASTTGSGRVPAAHWHSLADTIDFAYWQQAPTGKTLNDSPRICLFENLIPEEVCRWLIGVSNERLNRALVYDAAAREDYASKNRTNSWAQFDLVSSELIHLLVQHRMAAASGFPLHNMEATAILHYAVGEEITNHFDFVDPDIPNYEQEIARNGQRVMTFLIYLNDDYDRGETEFPKLGVTYKGRRGEGLYFINALDDGSPDLRTVHAGRPTANGEKWIVSQFIRNRRVLGA